MIESFQKPDGYLGIYFTVVDPKGRFRNFRDMHEMCKWTARFVPLGQADLQTTLVIS